MPGTIDMPHQYMNMEELTRFLGLDFRRVSRMAQRGDIPSQKVGGDFRFSRAEVTEWLQQQIGHDRHDWVSMDAGMSAHRKADPEDAQVSPLLQPETISVALAARTKASVLRELVALAQQTDRLYDGEALLEALNRREELCSTAMEAGVAIPHPRRPLPYAVAEPIIVIAHVPQGIGFGAPDGRLTDLFLMTCSQDDRHHLHVLARLCRMLSKKEFPQQLRESDTPQEIMDLMRSREEEIISTSGPN
jgi:PTS system nitrogen regulatory IIA component